MPVRLIAASANIVFVLRVYFVAVWNLTVSVPRLTSRHFLLVFHVTVKSKCWTGKMSTTNYCQRWSRSLRRSTRPPPPPALSSGPPVSQSRALQPCQPVRQTQPTCRQTLQRTWMCCVALCGAARSRAGYVTCTGHVPRATTYCIHGEIYHSVF